VGVDLTIAEIAARHHGVVSRSQLMAAGGTKAMIDHRIAIRRLHPVHAGVYSVGGARSPASRPACRECFRILLECG
jgi:hypothetical protein